MTHLSDYSFLHLTSCKIKYEEGFANIFGHIFTKPETMWTKADQDLVIPTDYSLCVGLSLQCGTLLLLQCFWNYLANSVAKASFMSSREFFFYIGWSIVSFVMFPVLQYNFSREVYDPTYKEIMPELLFGAELFFVSLLGFVSHFRFKKLLENTRESTNARSIMQKIRYFQELNIILAVILMVDALSFIILSVDGLTGKKYLNVHKFTADFFICNINVTSMIVWFIVGLILHPKPLTGGGSMQQQNHDFLTPKPNADSGFTGAPTGIMTQPSQASSNDYLSYNATPINYNTTFHHPLPTSSPAHQNDLMRSSTPSTATLVAPHHHYSIRRSTKDSHHIQQPQQHIAVNVPSETIEWSGKDGSVGQITDDATWLQQTPRGGNNR
ncbi:hypothetical protein BX666DRAFT_1874943 [Dichotomocladium elegans]|nr:hypothetical protein BX666DRAFT_1874943 [Dichotomocladium elegans]